MNFTIDMGTILALAGGIFGIVVAALKVRSYLADMKAALVAGTIAMRDEISKENKELKDQLTTLGLSLALLSQTTGNNSTHNQETLTRLEENIKTLTAEQNRLRDRVNGLQNDVAMCMGKLFNQRRPAPAEASGAYDQGKIG